MRKKLRDTLVYWKKINKSVQDGYAVAQFGPQSDYHLSTFEVMKTGLRVSIVETILYLQFAYNAMKLLKLVREWLSKIESVDHKNHLGLSDLEKRIDYVLSFIDEGE